MVLIRNLLFMLALAVFTPLYALIGMAIGAGQISRARKVAWTGGMVSAVMLGAVGLFFAAFPNLWSRMFTSEPRMVARPLRPATGNGRRAGGRWPLAAIPRACCRATNSSSSLDRKSVV